ncbi:MAG TPA: ABC transporter permease [Acidobacteria bacterium]|jgi:putative ABC transport system permease protein|nr:ABC transporter permease [Acidobacteriota bacterium]|tara:strand:- start:848 stop:2074 length:1227 start_codon:yes stop_codon:yes gene_type:complete
MSSFFEAIRLALGAIWSHKLRSLLTVLGNIVAVTSIIAVVTLIQGLNVAVSDAITSEAGADAFMVERVGLITDEDEAERARRLNPRITLDDAVAIDNYSSAVEAIMARVEQRGRVTYRGRELERTNIEGVSEDHIRFSNYGVERGRLITPTEVRRRRPVAVLGWGVADRLFEDVDPLDKTIRVEDQHFRVIGVSAKKGAIFGRSQDEFVIVPLGAHQKIFGIRRSLSLMVKPEDPSQMQKTMEDAVVALRIQRQLKPTQDNNFGLFTSGTILGLWETATEGIFAVLIGVVALSLVVGGIVIMNIMLMLVTERTREIGLRKALGARRRDITWQILAESIMLSFIGGVVGIVLGFGVALVIEQTTPVPAAVEGWSAVLGVGMTGIVGLIFGLYPALRAARLSPIEALGKE